MVQEKEGLVLGVQWWTFLMQEYVLVTKISGYLEKKKNNDSV